MAAPGPARTGRADAAHVRALLGADVRRLGPRFALSTVGVLAVLLLSITTGIGSRGFVTGITSALLFMQPMYLAMQIVKDRVDGTLDFLCSLPVTPETLAAVRVVPMAALSLLGGVAAAVLGLWHGVPASLGRGPVTVAATFLLVGALVPAALASVVLALSARFRFETLVMLPMLLVFGVVALGQAVARFVPDGTGAELRLLLTQPWVPAVLIATLCGALIGVVALAFRLTAHAFARFTPEARGG
jgi:ABC-type Na+ efflux pump permease subunit